MGDFWRGVKVLVTGGSGFIGSHVVEMLAERGAQVTITTSSKPSPFRFANHPGVRDGITRFAVDLTCLEDCMNVCRDQEVILNIAHVDGNTAFKQSRSAFIFRQNMLITMNMLEAACKNHADRFLVMSSAEVYSPEAATPTPESEGFKGLPDPITGGYAWSKRMSEFAANLFANEYGLKVAVARPSNVYGSRDYLDSNRARIIPTFIRKLFEGEKTLVIWGTGDQVRAFLHVEDLAHALLDLTEKYPHCDPVNLGGNREVTIEGLAELIGQVSGKRVEIVCEPDKPGGPPKRVCDITKAGRLLGFAPTVPLEIGLERTVNFFREFHFS